MVRTGVCELVGCQVPIQQAPMGTVSTPDLAVAVAEAGGIGSITALGIPTEVLDGMLADMAKRTDGVLAVNFLTAGLDREAVRAAAQRVRVVDFFWVDPDPSLVELAHAGGALVSWQVGSLAEAEAAVAAGADFLSVQGIEAGGHVRGSSPLLPLLCSVLDRVSVPVLAAGGIGNGRGLAAVIAAGASGARMGTRFLASEESGAHPLYKAAVIAAGADTTEITDAFAVCPLCATSPRVRVLRSAIHAVARTEAVQVGETVLGGRQVPIERGSGLPPGAQATGDIDAMALYAGESTALVHSAPPVAQLIAELTATAADLLDRAAG